MRVEDLRILTERMHEQFALRPVLAAELEWYVWPTTASPPCPPSHPFDNIANWVRDAASRLTIPLESVEPERGPGQLECALPPTTDALALAEALTGLRKAFTEEFRIHGYTTCFDAKPFSASDGSALHIHVHLEDALGNNLFWKDGQELSQTLAYALAGLLTTMEKNLPVFASTEASRARFVAGWHAPVNASWGNNNRTVALRLPDGTGGLAGSAALTQASPRRVRRIEHRVAGADANPHAVLAAILEGIHYGLTHQIMPPEPTHGDASHPQYGLKPFFS